MDTNLERLQAVGIAVEAPLREPYRSIVDELSEQEVDALIALKRRFGERSEVVAHRADTEPPPSEFFAVF